MYKRQVLGQSIPWQVALAAVFVEGLIFIVLSLTNVREAVVNAIPTTLKLAVTAGIGLFIAFIGFVDAGIIVTNDATKVSMGTFKSPAVLITVLGIIVIVVLSKKKVRGAILWGIVASAGAAWIYAMIAPITAATYGIYTPKGIFKLERYTHNIKICGYRRYRAFHCIYWFCKCGHCNYE